MAIRRVSILAGAAALLSPFAFSQNTGGVFGPVVNEDHASIQYRATYDPDSEGLAQRVHYQQSLNGELMWRVVAAVRKTESSDVDFDAARGELWWQISEDNQAYQTGLRFDAVLRDDDRPHSLGVNWTNQFTLGDGWSARALLLTSVDVGDNTRDGVSLQTRGQIARRLETGQHIGLQLYNSYGSTDDIRDFDDQVHQAGPFVSIPVGDDWSVLGQALFGLTDASADTNLRVWITRAF
ncbi:MAG: hypothetical protein AAFZ91_01390 [Pseudomonadota bacterium]